VAALTPEDLQSLDGLERRQIHDGDVISMFERDVELFVHSPLLSAQRHSRGNGEHCDQNEVSEFHSSLLLGLKFCKVCRTQGKAVTTVEHKNIQGIDFTRLMK
jgi:hypothetical protein